LIDIGWLDAPGARLPVSSDPLFKTTRCVTLRHTTVWPPGRVAGFGEKDCAPFSLTTLIVTTALGGVGIGVGVGAGIGVGATGVPPE
jgi:hypothetical protein